ncbi:alpha/beta hydrolase [Arthrobacter sp. OVS8]|nr:alpha/beta hydrolase [Arthrobacter sp. OVS8]
MDSEVRNLRLTTGISVPCLVRGSADARPLLLLHAWGESRRSFDRLVPWLAGFRVYAPDLRGQGEADKPADGYSLAEQAGDAAAILDALDVRKAFVLGSSSGGYVAQQLAVGHPERVAALVLVGTPLSLRGRPAFADEVDRLTDPVDEDWVRNSLSWFPCCMRCRGGSSRTGCRTASGCPRTHGSASSRACVRPRRPPSPERFMRPR